MLFLLAESIKLGSQSSRGRQCF